MPNPRTPLEELLIELHSATAKGLLAKIEAGEATPGDYSAAAKFLKDNGVDRLMVDAAPILDLAAHLPHRDPDMEIPMVGGDEDDAERRTYDSRAG